MNRTERARGALWGQACGDALGTTVEFDSAAQVRARSRADGWPQALVGQGPFHLLPGQITDDTELALALARSLVRRGRYDVEDVAASYRRWAASNPFDIGGATSQAFRGELRPGALAPQLQACASRQTEANGSVMRISPLGIFGAGLSRAALGELARLDSSLSHPRQVPVVASALFATTIADAIETGADGKTLSLRALDFAKGTPLEATLLAARDGLPESDLSNSGWVIIATLHAFFHLWNETPFEEALVQTVNEGGDTDTNAAIVGALLGAAQGEAAIPRRWRETVQQCVTPRPDEYRCGDLGALAEALLAASAKT